MAMTFDVPRCTVCGELAKGTLEQVPGIALLNFDEHDTAEYAGETELAWNDQGTCRDGDGRVTLECPRGHQWQARRIDECGESAADESLVSNRAMSKQPEQQYWLRIDGGLLRQQRLLLLTLVDSLRRNVPMAPRTQDATDLLEGISALLDEIADQAHDQYGIDCLLAHQEEDPPDQTANPGHQ